MAATDGGKLSPGMASFFRPNIVLKPESQEFACPPVSPQNVNLASFDCLVNENQAAVKVEAPTEAELTVAQPTTSPTSVLSSAEAFTCSSKSPFGPKKFTRVIENPGGEACLRRKMQEVTDFVVGSDKDLLASYELSSRIRRQQIYASFRKPSSPDVNRTRKKCRQRAANYIVKIPSKEADCDGGKMVANCTKKKSNKAYIQRVDHHPDFEKQTQTFMEHSSLIILADLDILTNQPKIVLTRCDIPKSLPNCQSEPVPESEPNMQAESASESEPESKPSVVQPQSTRQKKRRPTLAQVRARALNVSWKSSENKHGPICEMENIEEKDIVTRTRSSKPTFKKVIEDPKLEEQAERVLRNFTDFVTVHSLEIPPNKLSARAKKLPKRRCRRRPLRDKRWSPPSIMSTSSSEDELTSSGSRCSTSDSSNSSFYSYSEEEEPPLKVQRKALRPRTREAPAQKRRTVFEKRSSSRLPMKQQRYRKIVENPAAEEQAELVARDFIDLHYVPDRWAQQKQLNCQLNRQLLNSQIDEWQINSHINQPQRNFQVDSCSQTVLTLPLIVKPELSESLSSTTPASSSSNSCLQLPVNLDSEESSELIRVKSEPLDDPSLSAPPDTPVLNLFYPSSINHPNDGKTKEETITVKTEPLDAEEVTVTEQVIVNEQCPQLETAAVCESFELFRTQVPPTTISELHDSDPATAAVCESSELIRTQVPPTTISELHDSDPATAAVCESSELIRTQVPPTTISELHDSDPKTATVCESSELIRTQVPPTTISELNDSDPKTATVCESSELIRTQVPPTTISELHDSDPKTATVCESSELIRTQVPPTTISELHDSDPATAAVCESSELVRTQVPPTTISELHDSDPATATESSESETDSHKNHVSDIMSFCNSIIEKSTTISKVKKYDSKAKVLQSKTVRHRNPDVGVMSFCGDTCAIENSLISSEVRDSDVETVTDDSTTHPHEKFKSKIHAFPYRMARDNDIVVCSKSKVICRRRRDNDIKLFHKKVIENASAEARFDALVYRMSARYISEDASVSVQGHREEAT